jgi:hypothetical protein
LTCTDDTDCDDRLFCNGVEFCADDECHDCVSPCSEGQVCNETLDECSPNGAPGDAIHSAETIADSINPAGDTDPFTFTAEAGDTVVIQMSGDWSGLCCSNDGGPCIDLFGPSGGAPEASVCAHDYGTFGDYSALLQGYLLRESGRYTIVARDGRGDQTGEYSLSLVIIP